MFAGSSLPQKSVSAGHSDRTVMVTVQDLINTALGPSEGNKVNFKLIQRILHILARQMRIQEQFVDFGYEESLSSKSKGGDLNKRTTSNDGQNLQAKEKEISDKQREDEYERKKSFVRDIEIRKEAKLLKMTRKERADYKMAKVKERDIKENEEGNPEEITDIEKAEDEGQEAYKRDTSEQKKANLAKMTEKERAEYKRQILKEQDIDEKEITKIANLTDKERAEHESQKVNKQNMKEKAKIAEMTATEKVESKITKEKEQDIEETEKAMPVKVTNKEKAEYESQIAKGQDIEEKEKAKLTNTTDKERAEYESRKAKERDIEEKEKAELAQIETEFENKKPKERDVEDKEAKITSREREDSESQKSKKQDIDEKEKTKLAKMTDRDKAKYESQKSKERDMEEKENAKLAKIPEKERSEHESQIAKERDIEEKEKAKLAKLSKKESAEYESQKSKEQHMEEMENAKLAKMPEKDRSEYDSQIAKDQDSDEKKAKIAGRESVEYESQKGKEPGMQEKEEAKSAKITDIEKTEYESQKAKGRDMEQKKKGKLAKTNVQERAENESQKAKQRDFKEKEKAKLAKSTNKNRAAYESQESIGRDLEEKAKLAKMTDKERSVHEILKAKERVMEEWIKTNLAKMSDKVRAEYETYKAKEQDIDEKEKAELAKMDDNERTIHEIKKAKDRVMDERKQEMKEKISDKKKIGISGKDSLPRVGSVEVVTRSEFDLLEERVEDLEERVAPFPYPLLPFTCNLTNELSVGSFSLSDSMQALQMVARVQAAEEAVGRMADALIMALNERPVSEEVADKVKNATVGIGGAYDELKGVDTVQGRRASKVVDPNNVLKGSQSRQEYQTRSNVKTKDSMVLLQPQKSAYLETDSDKTTEGEECQASLKITEAVVSHRDLDYALGVLKDKMIKNANAMTLTAQKTAETAHYTVQDLVDLTKKLSNIDYRMNELQLLVGDYAQQLAGVDTAGVNALLASFYGQLTSMRSELDAGVLLFERTLNRETEDVKYLKSRYDELVKKLELMEWSHGQLVNYQGELTDEQTKLLGLVERLEEDKVDTDVLVDGLRDKADRSDLKGLMLIAEFNISRAAMDRSLQKLQDKFNLQDRAWMHTLKELNNMAVLKANIRMLLADKAEFEDQLMEVQQELNQVAKAIHGPKAALLIRQMKMFGQCGACTIEAMPKTDFIMPPRLPVAFRRHFPTTGAVCETPEPPPPPPPPPSQHVCRRWVGGSHTMLSHNVVRTKPSAPEHSPPKKKYIGYGDDGKSYKFEELLAPCSECTQLDGDVAGIPVDGAGDTGATRTNVNVKTSWQT